MNIKESTTQATEYTIVTKFENYLREDGKAESTIESYLTDIKGFRIWFCEKNDTFDGNLKRFHITSYKTHLISVGYSAATINKKINSLQSFNTFLIDNKYCNEHVVNPIRDKIKVAEGSEREVEVLTEEETEKLMFYISDRRKVDVRKSLVVTLLLYTGLRVTELVNLKLKDIDLLTFALTVRCGKGGKIREVPLRSEVTEAIKEYLCTDRKDNKHNDSEYLFLTQRSGKMDRDTVNKILKSIGNETRLNLYPHKFRHTFCTRLVKRGVELTTVAKLAGHANIQTTASFYINTSRVDKEQAVNLL